jgi:acetyl-CoA C-acetyltransferase
MTMPKHTHIPDNTPIIVGAGQSVERRTADSEPPFSSPMEIAAAACRAALKDAGASAKDIDTIAVIRLFSDAAKAWQSPFGGSNNPPESIARHLGASPKHRIYSNAGGTEPLQRLAEFFGDIARGEKELVLLAGAEAIANQRFAMRNGYELNWHEEFDAALDNREYRVRFASSEELNSGMGLPVHYYALIENYQAHELGHDLQQHRRHMAELMAPFSEVAAANPYSQTGIAYSAKELATQGKSNYPISLPYSKLLIAQDSVNQGAALLLTSAGKARELGIDPGNWIFVEAYAEGMDRCISQRENPGRSVAMEQVFASTLEMAGAKPGNMELIDIYSCFPCAVQSACDALELPTDGSRVLTVTGGLPYFGGPGNNYSMHALAEMAVRLRHGTSRGLVTANGGILSKHAVTVLSADCGSLDKFNWADDAVVSVDSDSIPLRSYCDSPVAGEVVSYTVIHRRDEEDVGIALAETPAKERFLASSTDPAVTTAMIECSPIGRTIDVVTEDDRHEFSFQQG